MHVLTIPLLGLSVRFRYGASQKRSLFPPIDERPFTLTACFTISFRFLENRTPACGTFLGP
jgi:hypothetical protein